MTEIKALKTDKKGVTKAESSIKDISAARKDFPLIANAGISYLDNAATTQKPSIVIDTLANFYRTTNANVHRGVYALSEKATAALEDARKTFARFISAEAEEIIFVRSATEGINNIASSLERTFELTKDHNIIITGIEHHSNLVPWQQLALRTGATLKAARYDESKDELEDIASLVDDDTVIVAFTHMSNVSGRILDATRIINDIRKKNKNAIIIVDATQAAAHMKLDVKSMDADFVCFSAHKVYGTTGVGIVYGKKKILESIEPFLYGGNMISSVSIESSSWAELPDKFEAGTIDTPGIVASAKALEYIESIGMGNITRHESTLSGYLIHKLREENVRIIGHTTEGYGPVVSFIVDGVHPHDLASIADEHGVCIRAGHHCCQPFMESLGVAATSRASISFYNTQEDIDKLIDAIRHAKKLLRK